MDYKRPWSLQGKRDQPRPWKLRRYNIHIKWYTSNYVLNFHYGRQATPFFFALRANETLTCRSERVGNVLPQCKNPRYDQPMPVSACFSGLATNPCMSVLGALAICLSKLSYNLQGGEFRDMNERKKLRLNHEEAEMVHTFISTASGPELIKQVAQYACVLRRVYIY